MSVKTRLEARVITDTRRQENGFIADTEPRDTKAILALIEAVEEMEHAPRIIKVGDDPVGITYRVVDIDSVKAALKAVTE